MLTVITGPMFSGKSSRLISMCTAHIIAGNRVVAFKPESDRRYSEGYIVSHSSDKFSAIPIPDDNPGKCWIEINKSNADVIAFDEVQFFRSYNIAQIVTQLLYIDKKTVICAGLSNDFDGRPFNAMPDLLCIADEIVSLTAVCSRCKQLEKATRTFRKKEFVGSPTICIGGSDKYEARCFKCWMEDAND